jgi:hypothetical protein
MTASVIDFAALRTARMLKVNAPPQWIDTFLARMTLSAREESDFGRESFWREVASLLRPVPVAEGS